MITHHLTASEYNNLWDQCVSNTRNQPSQDVLTHYLLNHFHAVSFSPRPRLKTSFGLVKFGNERDYNWFIMHL